MSELDELYQQIIVEHNRSPRNFKRLDDATRSADGDNPLCGDRITVFVKLDGDVISDIGFQGKGCAISKSSASLMTGAVKGRKVVPIRNRSASSPRSPACVSSLPGSSARISRGTRCTRRSRVLRSRSRRSNFAGMIEPVLEVRGISKTFSGHVAVTDLSLTVPKGAVYGLLGPNGAGKTTSIRMIMNITIPDVGTVRLFGDDLGGRHHSARIGYLPEERGLYKKMKVRDMLVFLAEVKGVARAAAAAKADQWLDRLGLGEWSRRKVEELSKGMSQKVQFIATMLHEPELLILDEPFSGLDPINAQVLKDIIVQLSRAGTTIIFSTHQMDVAEKICDHVCIIARGKKVLDGGLADVKREHGGTHVAVAFEDSAVGGQAMRAISDLVEAADDSGVFAELKLKDGADPQEVLRRLDLPRQGRTRRRRGRASRGGPCVKSGRSSGASSSSACATSGS